MNIFDVYVSTFRKTPALSLEYSALQCISCESMRKERRGHLDSTSAIEIPRARFEFSSLYLDNYVIRASFS